MPELNAPIKPPATVLLVEDSTDDAFLFTRAIKRAAVPLSVHTVTDGSEAISYLKAEPPYEDRSKFPFPKFIITDNRTKGMSGFEFLEWLNKQKACRGVPVVVLGGSDAPDEVKRAYDLGVHSYIVKPRTMQELEEVVSTFFTYWSNCQLPPADPNRRVP